MSVSGPVGLCAVAVDVEPALRHAPLLVGEASSTPGRRAISNARWCAPFDGSSSLSLGDLGDLVIENPNHLVAVVQVDPIDVQTAISSRDSEPVREALPKGDVKVALPDLRRRPEREARQ